MEFSVESAPPGADAFYRPYRGEPAAWDSLGKTPIQKLRVSKEFLLWRIVKPGYEPRTALRRPGPTGSAGGSSRAASIPPRALRPEWCRVAGGNIGLAIPGLDHLPEVPLDDYWIDQHEVTNEEFNEFVDAGGYQKARVLEAVLRREWTAARPGQEAIGALARRHGAARPGDLGARQFPEGTGETSRRGRELVRGRGLRGIRGQEPSDDLPLERGRADAREHARSCPEATFRGTETVAVGGDGALSGFGTTDMAGNVKEWCWNESTGGKPLHPGRRIRRADVHVHRPGRAVALGPPRRTTDSVASSSPRRLHRPRRRRIEAPFRDFSKEKPVSDEVFHAFKGLYAYDKGDLAAQSKTTAGHRGLDPGEESASTRRTAASASSPICFSRRTRPRPTRRSSTFRARAPSTRTSSVSPSTPTSFRRAAGPSSPRSTRAPSRGGTI